ncbi:MAG: carbohydrate kinase [Pseudomonadota bacterium]
MILCSGEALIDMLPRDSTGGEACFAPVAGGSVFNTAIALARLGAPVGLFTGLSDDLFGQRLAQALDRDGVATALANRSSRPTTLAFVELTDGQARYAFYDENTAGRLLVEDDLPTAAALTEVTAFFFGGISLMVEPCGAAYAALLGRVPEHRPVMLDPNIRPAFIAEPDRYRARIDAMLSRADILKVSDEDLSWLVGPGDPTDQARRLLERGPKIVCLTEGAQGVTAHHAAGHLHVRAPRVDVVDTVGAGDTFNAGFLAGLHAAHALDRDALLHPDEDVLEDALSLGVAAAAVTVSRAGANPPKRAELP